MRLLIILSVTVCWGLLVFTFTREDLKPLRLGLALCVALHTFRQVQYFKLLK